MELVIFSRQETTFHKHSRQQTKFYTF